MELTLDTSLNTAASSLDSGTTIGELFHIVASIPLKPLPKELPFRQVTTFGPPPKPTAPKPSTVVSRRASHTANMLHSTPSTINIEGRLMSMSFKRRMLKIRLDQLQNRTNSRKIRDQQILRRYKTHWQEMVVNCGDSSIDFDNDSTPTKHLNTGTLSNWKTIPFQRNSSTRRPCHRKCRKVTLPKSTERDEPMRDATVSPSLEVARKSSHKIPQPPSFRSKHFVQKRFGKVLISSFVTKQ